MVILETLVTAILVVITTTILFFQWSHAYWKKKNVYTLPPVFPYGNAKELFQRKESMGFAIYRAYKAIKARGLKYGGFYFLWQPMFVPVDLDLIRTILVKDFNNFMDHTNCVNENHDPLSGHLFGLTGLKWKAMRVKLSPTFSSGKLKAMFGTLLDCTKDLTVVFEEARKNNEPLDVKDVFARYTTDIIGSLGFGVESNSLKNPDSEFRKCGRRIFDREERMEAIRLFLSQFIPELFKLLRLSVTKKDVEDFIMKFAKETAEFRDKNNFVRKDFIQLLLDLRNSGIKFESKTNDNKTDLMYKQDGLTMNEIAAQMFVFFIGGFETTSTTLNFLMYELCVNPEIQEKVRSEIGQVLSRYDNQITYEATQEMPLLEQCIQETLRKYPPLSNIPRRCTKNYKIPDSDVVIEEGTNIIISAYGIHHDPEYYPNPEKFDPERFTEDNKKRRHPFAHIPFGEGPRTCIGLRLGLLQVKVGMITALKNFKFALSPETKIPLEYDPSQFILILKNNIYVNVEKIQ